MASEARLASPYPVAESGAAIPRDRPRAQWPMLLLLLPCLLFLAVLFAYPLMEMAGRSITPEGRNVSGTMTSVHYERAINPERPIFLRIILNTFQIALTVTAITLVLAYPLAYVLATASPRVVGVLMGLVLIPFFTSVLVRTYAWMVILGPGGLLNQALAGLDLNPVQFLYNRVGVLIGMTYALLPYMVLTLFSVMRGIDRSLMPAAHNLGASDWQAFRRVFFPLSLPGVVGGSLLVFILALGYFITPRLLGGDADQMIAMIIEYQVEIALNFNFASALAVILLIVTLLGFVLYNRLVGLQTLFESKTS